MSFLLLMIKIALVIYVIKFVGDVTFGLLALRSAKLSVMGDTRTVDATAKEVK